MRKKMLQAFTLLELTISIAIMALMTTILLFRYPDTSIRLNLVNLTHTLALSFREAQLRGSAVESASGAIAGYGVFFSIASNTQYILFGDTVTSLVKNGIYIGDGLYSTTPIDETKSITQLPNKYTFSKICVGTSEPFSCNSYANPQVSTLTVSFIRPDPEALIYINNSTSTMYAGACVELRSPRAPASGHIRSVRVFKAGLIVTSNKPCDNN